MKLTYRPEIDGLRAIAVVAVIIYHAQITILNYRPFQGGFIGVDIFFVISGYLITSIILKELLTTGSFSFKYFYERRIRRILPALLFVMILTLPLAWMYLIPVSFIDFSKSILYSLGFTSNLYFHYIGQLYGAENALLIPFLHTWSLSVEEQYYILFPIALLFLFKYFKNYIIHILFFFFFISLFLADWGSKNHASFTFYALPTRGWELILGSLLAYFELKTGRRGKNRLFNSLMPSIGLIIISFSIFFFHDQMFHPSIKTLIPVTGVCLIIWFSNKDEIVTKILSSKLFVGVGLISYSLYLWHYPIFAFARIIEFTQGSIIKKLLLGLIILALSVFSYYFVERPARNKKNRFNRIIKVLITVILSLSIFNFVSINQNGYENRASLPKVLVKASKKLDYRSIRQNNKSCHNRLGKDGFCIFNQSTDNIGDIILLGDSQTDALLGNLVEQISNTKFRLIHMSYSGNLYLPNFVRMNKRDKTILQDEIWHDYRSKFLNKKAHKNTYIIIFGRYDFYFEKTLNISNNLIFIGEEDYSYIERNNLDLKYEERIKLFKDKFKNTIESLSLDKKVFVLYPTPVSGEKIFQRILKNKKKISQTKNYHLNDIVNYSLKFHKEYFSDEIKLLDSLNSDNIYRIKSDELFCPNDQCFLYDNENVYIFDTNHPSYKGSQMINDLIMEKINQIELKPN